MGIGKVMVVVAMIVFTAKPTVSFSLAFPFNGRISDSLPEHSCTSQRSRFSRIVPHMQIDQEDVKSHDRRVVLASFWPAAVTAATLMRPATAASVGPGNQHAEQIVLVIGATSTMGQEACKDLLEMGFRVRGFTRRAEDVKKAVIGTEFADIEWVNGDLKEKTGLESAMKGVSKVIFAPLLATRAGSDPEYFRTAVDQDIQMNRLIFAEGACTQAKCDE